MNVARVSIWSPDYTATTMVVPEESITVSMSDFVAHMMDGPAGYFFTYELLDTGSDDLVEATAAAMQAFGEQGNDERNMAIMYYYTAARFRIANPSGVIFQTIPSPLDVAQLTYVLKELVKHPDYQGQRIVAIAEDHRMVEAREDEIREIDAP